MLPRPAKQRARLLFFPEAREVWSQYESVQTPVVSRALEYRLASFHSVEDTVASLQREDAALGQTSAGVVAQKRGSVTSLF